MLRKETIYDSSVSSSSLNPCLFSTPLRINSLTLCLQTSTFDLVMLINTDDFSSFSILFFGVYLFIANQNWSKLVVVKNHEVFLF